MGKGTGENLKGLKDALKPPFVEKSFYRGGLYIADQNGDAVCMMLEMNAYTYDFFDELKAFAVEALNNEWARRFGGRLRWKFDISYGLGDDTIECPNCGYCLTVIDNPAEESSDYCGGCGARLLPAENVEWEDENGGE